MIGKHRHRILFICQTSNKIPADFDRELEIPIEARGISVESQEMKYPLFSKYI